MIKNKKPELKYICCCLYGNLKKREYSEEHTIELKDIVQFEALYNNDLNNNRQQKIGAFVPGKHEVETSEKDWVNIFWFPKLINAVDAIEVMIWFKVAANSIKQIDTNFLEISKKNRVIFDA